MKKKCILILVFALLLLGILFINSNECQAADLDRITNYVVTVDPRMNDGTLDITYEITWKVLDSTTEGPLTWVKIGTPNSNFTDATALTSNIKSIRAYSGSYVRIDFTKSYRANESITFKYSIHQKNMYKLSGKKCTYEFTPAWFTDARVDSLTIKWNSDKVKSSDSTKKQDNYLVWKKTNMSKGAKLTAKIEYDKSSFSSVSESGQVKNDTTNYFSMILGMFFPILFIAIIIIVISILGGGGGGYYRHRGFYGGPRIYMGGRCAHSSCACASSCASSCACACAGSGRAGCSKKDFYGTNLTSEKIKKATKSQK